MEFKDRLRKYREDCGIKLKRDMASKLEISESFYNLIENGSRPVSKNVLRKLVLITNLPEEYWLYGITDETEILEKREEFKCIKDAIEQLDSIGLLDINKEFSDGVKEVLLAAVIADVTHILERKKLKK